MKTELKNLQDRFNTIALSNSTFLLKNADFFQKKLASAKFRGAWY